MSDCTPAMPKPTWPVNEHALTTPRPTGPGLVECTPTVSMSAHTGPTTSTHVVSQSTVPVAVPTLPEAKPQLATSSLAVHPSTPPAPEVTQPQVVLIKQFQQPKPYSGSSSWKGYREYFERLAAVNGWATATQKVEQLALALEGPATDVLRDLDTSQPQAYNIIWEALARSMALERQCAALTFGARKTVKPSQTLSRPSVLCIERLGLLPPLSRGMQH